MLYSLRYSFGFGLLLVSLAACDNHGELVGSPEIEVIDQFLVSDQLSIKSVALDRPGWIVIWHGGQSGGAPQLIGKRLVEAGRRWDIAVDINEDFADRFTYQEVSTVRAVLHYDTGAQDVFEFEGFSFEFEGFSGSHDPPVMLKGEALAQPFRIYHTTSIPESYIIVNDQEIEARTIVIEEIKMSEPGDVVIHRDKGDAPLVPGIIGKTALEEGVSQNVEVKLFRGEDVRCGEKIWPMLHVRSTSDDQPYDLDQPIITEPLINSCIRK